MAADSIDSRLVESFLFAIYKSMHASMGDAAAGLMRQAAPDFLWGMEFLGVKFDGKDVATLAQQITDAAKGGGLIDRLEFKQEGHTLVAEGYGCALHNMTEQLEKLGIGTFGCPFLAVTIACAEKKLNMRARLKKFEHAANGPSNCRMTMELFPKD
ncbi:MAG: hypothetical protein WCI05_14675 [Myxococcales bacterium]|jgi:hypothetical protein